MFQKQNDKSYSPVDITDYLKDITLNGQSYNSEISEFTFDKNSLKNNIFKIPTAYTVKSGEEFENENKLYSNYKVLMSVQLLDDNKNPIANSSCDDYIVYTNAKIYTELIPRI